MPGFKIFRKFNRSSIEDSIGEKKKRDSGAETIKDLKGSSSSCTVSSSSSPASSIKESKETENNKRRKTMKYKPEAKQPPYSNESNKESIESTDSSVSKRKPRNAMEITLTLDERDSSETVTSHSHEIETNSGIPSEERDTRETETEEINNSVGFRSCVGEIQDDDDFFGGLSNEEKEILLLKTQYKDFNINEIESHLAEAEKAINENYLLVDNAVVATYADITNQLIAKIKFLKMTSIAVHTNYEFVSSFTQRELVLMIITIACSNFLSPVSNVGFLPAVQEVADTFGVSIQTINISNAMYTGIMALSPCIFAPLSDIFGRKAIFMWCAAGLMLGSCGTALSPNIYLFFIFRAISSLFGNAISIGGCMIGDVVPARKRGKFLGYALVGTQLGPTIGPVIGGLCVHLVSWRYIFGINFIIGLIILSLCIFFLRETYQPAAEPTNKVRKRYDPLAVIKVFRCWNFVLIAFVSMVIVFNMFCLVTPIRSVINPRFGMNSALEASIFFVPAGLGLVIGSLIGGVFSDYILKKRGEKCNGTTTPEDRLYAPCFALLVVLPATMIVYGWTLEYAAGGIAVPIVCMFIAGFGQALAFPGINAYCIECIPEKKSSALASNYFARFVGGAVASAVCKLEIDEIGIGLTSTISAIFLVIGFSVLLILIKFGEKLRS
ncbi:unnamed protein product [[Candida] boidinii]|uniref:Unnamed protein product n=1 Tax=Candida boidinii TaxID=5477 RepID=A0A9W6SSP7_CANBO|nr:hypothetical protein B5S30_g1826 [[Candida] boidinii]GME66550.1 unnamed protein product [[Candida] boidinii]